MSGDEKGLLTLFIIWFIICLLVSIGVVIVALHFILKLW